MQKNISKNPVMITLDPVCVTTDEKVFKEISKEFEDCKDFYSETA